jgi:hypothetical protein
VVGYHHSLQNGPTSLTCKSIGASLKFNVHLEKGICRNLSLWFRAFLSREVCKYRKQTCFEFSASDKSAN